MTTHIDLPVQTIETVRVVSADTVAGFKLVNLASFDPARDTVAAGDTAPTPERLAALSALLAVSLGDRMRNGIDEDA